MTEISTEGPGTGRVRVALVFGGRSSEHAISCLTAASVIAALDPDRFDVVPVGITLDGRWALTSSAPAAIGSALPSVPATGATVAVPPQLGEVDVVFPLLHGPFGEDGTLQGMLELADVPYVGSGVFASAAAMDKDHMKRMLGAAGLSSPAYVVVREGRHLPHEVGDLGFPVFVKPARGGSSIGISKVTDGAGLDAALAEAHRHDPKALVEAAVVGREIECGVLVDADGTPRASLPAEVRVGPDVDFYDFAAKYGEGSGTDFDIPPALPPETIQAIQDTAVRAFEALDCEGLARVDFFLTEDGGVVVNEVNTMPGFTPVSMFPRMWAASGVDYPSLVARLVEDALRRGTGLR